MVEIKSIINFFVFTFVSSSLFLNIKAWLLGDNPNKYLTLAISFLALVALGIRIMISYETWREKRHNNKIRDREFDDKYPKKK